MRSITNQVFNDLFIHGRLTSAAREFYRDSDGSYHFTGLSVVGDIVINTMANNKYYFKNCVFENQFIINSPRAPFLQFDNCTFKSKLHVIAPTINDFEIINCSYERQFLIESGIYQSCYFSFATCYDFSITGGKFDSLIIGYWGSQSYIRTLSLRINKISGNILVEKSKIKRFELSKGHTLADLTVENCKFHSVNIYKLHVNSKITFHTVKSYRLNSEQSCFTLFDSNLGSAQLSNIDFASYNEVNHVNSYVSEAKIINCRWTKNINNFLGKYNYGYKTDRAFKKSFILTGLLKARIIKQYPYKETNTQIEGRLDAYKQLKHAYEKQSDSINAKWFHSLELKALLSITHPIKQFSSWIVLFLSNITSNFGLSLSRPLLTILILNGILFQYLVHATNIPSVEPAPIMQSDINSFAEFLNYCNPLHKNVPPLKGGGFIIDLHMRIVSSYSIYNFIRATRRYIQ